MAWRDNLRKASFRGVAFHYAEADSDFGRRLARHEYPGRDIPFIEDMGRKAREHNLQAYVLEPDHLGQAARLVEACEKPGAGTLVHPYLGEMQVVCTASRQHFTTRDGGMASFQLTFVESGNNRYPTAQANTAATVNLAADAASIAVKNDFEGVFNVNGLPGFVGDEAATVTGLAADDMSASIKGAIQAGKNSAAFMRDVAALKAEAATLVRDPKTLATRIADLAGYPATVKAGPINTVFSPLTGFGGALAAVPTTTPSRRAQGANQSALVDLVRRAGIIEQVRAAAGQSFATRGEATDTRDRLTDLIDGQVSSATDSIYRAFADLGAALVRHVSMTAPALPRVIRYVATTTRPALAIAQDLYGDDPTAVTWRAEEIARRNGMRHLGFAPGGETLEVLSHV